MQTAGCVAVGIPGDQNREDEQWTYNETRTGVWHYCAPQSPKRSGRRTRSAFCFEELIAERDDLSNARTTSNSLARLMEKTVADADDLAAQIRREAEEKAQAEDLGEAHRRGRSPVPTGHRGDQVQGGGRGRE